MLVIRCDATDFQDEQPEHAVTLDGYWMQRTEVTNEQYKRCVDAGGCPDEPQSILGNASFGAACR